MKDTAAKTKQQMKRNRWHDTRKSPRKGDSLSGGVLFGTRPKKDVYKRQPHAFAVVKNANITVNSNTEATDITTNTPMPVSYTHLDVYKRQAMKNWPSKR